MVTDESFYKHKGKSSEAPPGLEAEFSLPSKERNFIEGGGLSHTQLLYERLQTS